MRYIFHQRKWSATGVDPTFPPTMAARWIRHLFTAECSLFSRKHNPKKEKTNNDRLHKSISLGRSITIYQIGRIPWAPISQFSRPILKVFLDNRQTCHKLFQFALLLSVYPIYPSIYLPSLVSHGTDESHPDANGWGGGLLVSNKMECCPFGWWGLNQRICWTICQKGDGRKRVTLNRKTEPRGPIDRAID